VRPVVPAPPVAPRAAVAVRKTGTGAGLSWLLGDRQGSATIAVNATTGAAVRDRYLPYGGRRSSGGSPLPTDRGWIGQTQDADTGLDYLNARYYDPQSAHFISADPLNDTDSPQAANPYAYGAANPITFSDPSGLAVQKVLYKVQPGQNWYTVASLYHVSLDQLRAWNGGSLAALARYQVVVAYQYDTAVNASSTGSGAAKAKAVLKAAATELVKIAADVIGVTDALNCFLKADLGGCLSTGLTVVAALSGSLLVKIAAKYGAPWKWKAGLALINKIKNLAGKAIGAVKDLIASRKAAGAAGRAAKSCLTNSFTAPTLVLMQGGVQSRLAWSGGGLAGQG